MLEWASPLWFLALPLALLPLLGEWRPWAVRFSALSLVEARWTPRRVLAALPALLRAACMALVVIALARPQHVERETVRESEGVDIMLAIDTSGSMRTQDMESGGRAYSRLEAAKAVMRQFVDGRPEDRVGVVAFGAEAFVQAPLTLDHALLDEFIAAMDIGMAGQSTAVGDAIAVAAKHMKGLPAPSKIVVLVTDGQSTAGQVDPIPAAQAAAALGVKVYTIGVGAAGGRGLLGGLLGGGGAQIDEATLRRVAAITGAQYWRAADANALAQVYATIDELERSPAKVKEYVHRDELYLRYVLWAVGLFLAELLLSAGPLRRLP